MKRRREEAGLTQVELGALVFVSGGYIGQFEQAIRKPQLDVAMRIDDILQTAGFFERTWRKLIDDKRYADYFAAVVELERTATKICEFAPTVIPGLLQTAAYAQAVTLAANPFVTDEYVDEKVGARLERARILKDATRPEYWAILHENTLRTPVGGPAAMADASHLGLGLDLADTGDQGGQTIGAQTQHLDGRRDAGPAFRIGDEQHGGQSFRILERNCATRGCARPPSAAKNSLVGRSTSSTPFSRKTIRLEICRANSISWVTNTMVVPLVASLARISSTSEVISGSSALVTSSSSR